MKKRNKKYTPRHASIPMMAETRDRLALALRMSFETLITTPTVESYNAASLQLVTLGRAMGKQEYLERAKAALLAIAGRFERVGKMGVSGPEAAVLRDTSRLIDHAIGLVSLSKFAAAQAKTDVWCAQNGVAA
jgi:uncharacterized protein YyaL (SSP411 family)